MDKGACADEVEADPALPVTSPNAASSVVLEDFSPPKYSVINRRGTGTVGRRMPLLANHFKVNINVPDVVFYQYTVCFTSTTSSYQYC